MLSETGCSGKDLGSSGLPFPEPICRSAQGCGPPYVSFSCKVAVVVDTFAEARQRDVLNLAEEMENNVAVDRQRLERIFKRSWAHEHFSVAL